MCHLILTKKLSLYNFDTSSISWIMSYLSNRTQAVQVESKVSEPLECGDHGVSQGSILGGLLHVINSNDFPDCHDEGDSVIYVDDDTDNVHAADPVQLQHIMQKEVNNSVSWLQDNQLCVAGDKSKFMIIGTSQLRASKLNEALAIQVDGKEVIESESEKLLGVVVNNKLTWQHHLHGNEENSGLIPQLKQRVGTLKRLSKYMNKGRLKMTTSGIFYSKLVYCLPVFGNVFGLEKYKETCSKSLSFTTSDCRKLQVIQNSVNRLLTGARYDTPTVELLSKTNSMSIHQMVAYHTLVMVHKVVNTGKPSYLADRLKMKVRRGLREQGDMMLAQSDQTLSVSRGGFVYRGGKLFNMLDMTLREEKSLKKFKEGARIWTKKNIQIKPGI